MVVLNAAYAKMAQMVGVMKAAGIRVKNVIMTGTTNVVLIGATNVTISMTVSQEPVHLGSIIQILLVESLQWRCERPFGKSKFIVIRLRS